MARRRYLIAYDICDARRLRRVIKLMESYGERLQYSVFLCDLSSVERIQWEGKILDAIALNADSVVVIDLGQPASEALQVIGTARRLPRAGPTVL